MTRVTQTHLVCLKYVLPMCVYTCGIMIFNFFLFVLFCVMWGCMYVRVCLIAVCFCMCVCVCAPVYLIREVIVLSFPMKVF